MKGASANVLFARGVAIVRTRMPNTLASFAGQALLIYCGVNLALAFLRRPDDYITVVMRFNPAEPHGSQAKF
jgi:hypothetical protein